jgi:hypothetical protein
MASKLELLMVAMKVEMLVVLARLLDVKLAVEMVDLMVD